MDKIQFNMFCGNGRERMIQITQGFGGCSSMKQLEEDEPGYIQLTVAEAKKTVKELTDFIKNTSIMKCYITFGQIHAHSVEGKTLDKDCVAEIEATDLSAGHAKAMDWFKGKFHNCTELPPDMSYFPRGIIKI